MDANVSYSLGCIWLVFLTDLSGIGPVVLSSDNVPLSLALLQWVRLLLRVLRVVHAVCAAALLRCLRADAARLLWQGAFVAPTVASTVSAGYDLRRTFSLRGCSATQLGAATAGGAALWVLLAAATALRGGVAPDGAEASYRIVEGAATLWGAPADAAGWASLLGLGALAPAAGEELLFRGYLLTALRSRLGRYDAVRVLTMHAALAQRLRSRARADCAAARAQAALCAALFACFHLSFTQFFPTAVLGLAAGAAAVSSESIVPAVALHAAHNAAALAWGAAVCEGALPPGPPPMWAVVAAAGVAAAAATVGAREADGGEGAQD